MIDSLDAAPLPPKQFLVGGRGYGKNAAAAEAARRRFLDSLPIGKPRTFAPGIGNVTWACDKPTAPVYRPGTFGWYIQENERRMRAAGHWDAMVKHNQRIAAENAALFEATLALLGGK